MKKIEDILVENIIARRTALGLSQRGLVTRAGLDPVTMNKIERGKRVPGKATLEILAEALECSTGDLYSADFKDRPLGSTPGVISFESFKYSKDVRDRLDRMTMHEIASYVEELERSREQVTETDTELKALLDKCSRIASVLRPLASEFLELLANFDAKQANELRKFLDALKRLNAKAT